MKNKLYPLLLGIFLFVMPQTIFATHIVGGEMNYTCLGNDMYEISLTVFRDCDTGVPDFDDPASIGIFSYNAITDSYFLNTALGDQGQLLIPVMNNDTLDPTLSNPCLVVPPNVCVNTTTYTVIANLPFQSGGYLLAYQRCCRNQSILNIVNPLDVGATYTAVLSETTLLECNSNAVFNEWPPIYICVNEPIIFDHSATDINGDSLVYRLCIPYVGASPDDPMPQPPAVPPYDEVTWIDPPYNLSNVMGGIPLTIDSETGLLTGTPNTIGQFVVGICVDEYRNGELISTTRRDFQYNVGLCGTLTSSFFVPETSCEGLEVSFDNQSNSAQNYTWYFNDPNNPGATSTDFEPTYTYSDTGTYTVMLVVDANAITCTDTSYSTFSVYEPSLTSNFNYNVVGCDNLIEIELANLSDDTVFDLVAWEWSINNTPFSNSEHPPNYVGNPSTFPLTVSLTITNEVGCQITYEQEISYLVTADFFVPDLNCEGLEVTFENLSENSESFLWYFNDPNNPGATSSETNPTFTYSTAGTYTVMLVAQPDATICNDTSYATFSISPPSLFANFDADINCQNQLEIQLSDMSTDTLFNITNWEWTIDNIFYSASENPPIYMGSLLDSSFLISLTVTNEFGCIDTFEQIINYGFQLDYDNILTICDRVDTTTLLVTTSSNLDSIDFEWQPSAAIISGGNTNMPLVDLTIDSVFYFTVNDNGCIFEDSIIIMNGFNNLMLQATATPDTIYAGETSQLEVTPISSATYDWYPSTSLSNSNIYNPVASPETTTEYTVEVTSPNGCVDTTSVTVVVIELSCEEPFLFMPNAFSPNGDGENDILYVEGNAIEEMYLAIYNRWGEKVFESKDKNLGWDGTYKNQLLEPDVYGYYLTIKCVGGDDFFKKGNINLIR